MPLRINLDDDRSQSVNQIGMYLKNGSVFAICCFASISYTKYGAAFTSELGNNPIDSSAVSYSWFNSLDNQQKSLVVFCALSTFIINSNYQYISINRLLQIGQQDFHLLLKNENIPKTLLTAFAAFLAAVAGGAIAGNAFSGALQWPSRFLGFIIYFTYSYSGTHDLIRLFDSTTRHQQKIIFKLNYLNNEVFNAKNWWQNKNLNPELVNEFLIKILATEKLNPAIFHDLTQRQQRYQLAATALDYSLSFIFAGSWGFIFTISGFAGFNLLNNNRLSPLANLEKIPIGFIFALPMILFIFFIAKVVHGSGIKAFYAADNNPTNYAKMALITLLCLAGGTWSFSLARGIGRHDTLFYPALDGSFGSIGLPIICYISSVSGMLNLLMSKYLTITHRDESPEPEMVIRYIEKNPNLIPQPNRYRYFSRITQSQTAEENLDDLENNSPTL